MLKSTLQAKDNIDIDNFCKLKNFLKRKSTGYQPRTSMIFSRENINKFITEAPDETYLLMKVYPHLFFLIAAFTFFTLLQVVVLFGICGACSREELHDISILDIQDKDDTLVVSLPDTKTNHKRFFTLINEMEVINTRQLYKKYIALRPEHINHDKLFIFYKDNKCTVQRIGINTLGKVPSKIAKYLMLSNAEQYTGDCFRRSSASLLADAGMPLASIKRHVGRKNTIVPAAFVEDSIEMKKQYTRFILQSESATTSSAVCSMSKPDESSAHNVNLSLCGTNTDFKEVTGCASNFYVNN